MDPDIKQFVDRFNKIVHDAERFAYFTRAIEFQKEGIRNLEVLQPGIDEIKSRVVKSADNDSANLLLGLSRIALALTEELKMVVALKEDRPGEAWDALVCAQEYVSTAVKADDNLAYVEGYAEKLNAVEKVVFPPQTCFSPGLVVMKSRCSICNIDYGECDHVQGKAYMGELCARIIEECDLREVSIVSEPANKHARAHSFSDGGGQRDIMTWRMLPPEERPGHNAT